MEHGVVRKRLGMFSQRRQKLTFPGSAWLKLDRLGSGVGLLRSETNKLGMASTTTCDSGAKKQTAEYITPSKWSSCSFRCQQELGELADENMSGHLVEHPAPVHLPQTKKKN